jgi:hypothetical protein
LVLIKKNILRNTLRREYNTVISVNSYARPNIFQLSLRIGLQILKLKCREKLSMTLAQFMIITQKVLPEQISTPRDQWYKKVNLKIWTKFSNYVALYFLFCYNSTSGTRHVNLVTKPVISHKWGKDREVFTTSGTYPWSFVTQIFNNGQPTRFLVGFVLLDL